MKVSTFILLCEAIVAERGENREDTGNVFEDDKLKVTSKPGDKGRELEITLFYDPANKFKNNPVICAKGDNVFRHHGEWTLLEEHVQGLVRDL